MLKRLMMKRIIKALGTFNNIEAFTNCGTRLRVHVRNTNVVDYKYIEGLAKVKGIIVKGDYLEIVFGMDTYKYANAIESLMA